MTFIISSHSFNSYYIKWWHWTFKYKNSIIDLDFACKIKLSKKGSVDLEAYELTQLVKQITDMQHMLSEFDSNSKAEVMVKSTQNVSKIISTRLNHQYWTFLSNQATKISYPNFQFTKSLQHTINLFPY